MGSFFSRRFTDHRCTERAVCAPLTGPSSHVCRAGAEIPDITDAAGRALMRMRAHSAKGPWPPDLGNEVLHPFLLALKHRNVKVLTTVRGEPPGWEDVEQST